MIKDLKNISVRLMVLLASILVLVATLTGFAIKALNSAIQDQATIYEQKLPPIPLSAQIQLHLQEMRCQSMLGARNGNMAIS